MGTLFFIALGVGAGFVVLTLVLGQAFGAFSIDFDTGGASPFKPIFIALFLTAFGGLGLIFYPWTGPWLAAVIGAVGGFGLTYVILRYILIPLKRWQNTTTHEKQSMVGKTAKVTESILQGGYGKITYTVNDKIVSGPAKSEDGTPIERNTEVDIIYIERNTYFVRTKNKYTN
ncbi:MAG: NfeD family protein [Clostridiales bacterium]|jgi:membrane protein implicated in regulation of membrane protease activity|nr:NfeD family protein [Clostridiales bacterium]